MIADTSNIPINVKKLVPNFLIKKSMCFVIRYHNLQLYLRLGLKLWFNQSQRLKSYIEFNTQKRITAEKNGDKDVRFNRIDARLVSNEKDYLKWTSKLSYMSQKSFHNYLDTIRKSKVTLTVNKPALGCVVRFK